MRQMSINVCCALAILTVAAGSPSAAFAAGPKIGPGLSKPFTLIDHKGSTFTQRDFDGKWSLVFFGYTHCPDVCPITLSVVKDVHQLLKDRGINQQQLQYLFVSVDPDRDTPVQLAKYVKFFGGFLTGLTGNIDDIERLVLACGAHYEFDDPDDKGNYTISHTASLALVNPKGELMGHYPEPHDAVSISNSLIKVALGGK